jgi:hypothetical protein
MVMDLRNSQRGRQSGHGPLRPGLAGASSGCLRQPANEQEKGRPQPPFIVKTDYLVLLAFFLP